ncbi:MAG: RNA polymerase sigma factor [Vicinamibacteraceae bacterium]|nr:RNA polymerase sigma factor [Vicinamibacteraceae bacterium]
MTDDELVERARQGQTAAFGELVDRHRHAVVRTAYAALGCAAEADDVAQEACVLAFKRLAQFRGEAAFKTWLLAVTWRTAIDRRRSWIRRAKRYLQGPAARDGASGRAMADLVDSVPSHERSPEQAVIDTDNLALVRRIIEGLPSTLREALLLAAAGELSYAQAADLQGIPLGTFKWRVTEARRQLRARLIRMGHRHE